MTTTPNHPQKKPASKTSHLSSLQFVLQYLYRTKSVFEQLFGVLGSTQGSQSEEYLKNAIQEWKQAAANDPTADFAEKRIRDLGSDLEILRLERSVYGNTFLHMASAAVAASIISIADQGIRLGERQQGSTTSGRMVHSRYSFREFIRFSRNHGAHFWDEPSEADRKRLEFQKTVLNYDQEADGSNINHSVALLEKLGWHQYQDVANDLMDLFDPTR